jgi:hypothetical protein
MVMIRELPAECALARTFRTNNDNFFYPGHGGKDCKVKCKAESELRYFYAQLRRKDDS